MKSVLTITGLCKSFGGIQAIKSVNLSINKGERHLLIGPNGAGKTTLFNLIAGDLYPDSGKIFLNQKDVTRLSNYKRAKLSVSRTYQIITLFGKDNLVHNVKLALLAKSWDKWKCWDQFSSKKNLTESALKISNKVGLEHKAFLPLEETSYGEKRRLEIAMALAQDPEILLLDEPLAGLSIEERESIQSLLSNIDKKITILMIEHDMEVALSFADCITLLHHGEVIVSGTKDEVINDPRTEEIYLGERVN